jgi:hypothetical protein
VVFPQVFKLIESCHNPFLGYFLNYFSLLKNIRTKNKKKIPKKNNSSEKRMPKRPENG